MPGLRRDFAWLVLLSSAGYLASFASQLLISYHFGTSRQLDAYWAALAVLNFLGFYIHPIREALVPGFHRSAKRDVTAAHAYFTQALALVMALAAAASLAMLAIPGGWAVFVTAAGDAALRTEVAAMVRLLAPAVVFLALSEVLNALLSSYKRVLFQQAVRLVGALSMLACLGALSGRWGSYALVVGFIAAQAVMAAAQALLLLRLGLRLKLSSRIVLDAPFFAVAGALTVSYACAQAYAVYEKNVFTWFGTGWISAFQYGMALVNVVVSVLAASLANMLWPRFLDAASAGDPQAARRAAARAIAFLLLALGPVTLLCFREASAVIELVFARGAFGAESLERTTTAFRAAVFTALPAAIIHVLARALVSARAARALGAIGITIAAAGTATLELARFADNVQFALHHWLIGNVAGAALAGWLFLRGGELGADRAQRVLGWGMRWALVMGATYWLAPHASLSVPGKPGLAIDLMTNFLMLAAAFWAACWLAGLFRLRTDAPALRTGGGP